MKLNENTIVMLSSLLLADFMGENHELAGEVDTLLHAENEKHTAEQSVEEHLEAAIRHIRLGLDSADSDSGQPHRAHVAARLLLGLMMVSKGDERC